MVRVVAMVTHVSVPRLLVHRQKRLEIHNLLIFDLLVSTGRHQLSVPLLQGECEHLKLWYGTQTTRGNGGPHHTVGNVKTTIRIKITNRWGTYHLEEGGGAVRVRERERES